MRDMSEEITLTNSGDFQSTGKSGIYEGSVVHYKNGLISYIFIFPGNF